MFFFIGIVTYRNLEKQSFLPQNEIARRVRSNPVRNASEEELLAQAKEGIESYLTKEYNEGNITDEIYQKAIEFAYPALENWVKDPNIERISPNTDDAILEAIEEGRWEDIVEAFRQKITFGTAGIRGKAVLSKEELKLLAIDGPEAEILKGPNTINDIVLLKKTAGVIKYAKEKGLHKVAIGYDSRIAGKRFAELIAQSFIGQSTEDHKFKVYLFDEASPFPELSFGLTTKEVRADLGILISASHNPADFNGYKITDNTGAQLNRKMRNDIVNAISKVTTDDIKLKDLEDAEEGQLIWLGGEEPLKDKDYKGVDVSNSNYFIDMHTLHAEQVKKFIIDKEVIEKYGPKLKIGYAAFNGAGNKAVPRLLDEMGFDNVQVIDSLQELDGMYPAFGWGEQPDPGDPRAAEIAVEEFVKQYGQEAFDKLDFLIGTDPDADRAGFIVKIPKEQQEKFGLDEDYMLLTANDAWTLLLWYRLKREQELNGGILPQADKKYITLSHVTTDALPAVAELFGVRALGVLENEEGKEVGGYLNGRRTWVGFSDIADYVKQAREEGLINVGGFEESNGFSILGGPVSEGEVLSENGHVNDKDGTFAALLMAEVAAYAKSQGKTLYELLNQVYEKIGVYATANRPLPRVGEFEGAEGISKKIKLLKKVQQWYKEANEKADSKEPFTLAGLPVIGAIQWQTGKYDDEHYEGFPDQGIRFFFPDPNMKPGAPYYESKNYITIRPSGTSQKIRFYTQLHTWEVDNKYNRFRQAEALALQAQIQLLKDCGYSEDIKEVVKQLKNMGFDPTTAIEFIGMDY